MAKKDYSLNDPIKVYYQAPNRETGLTINMKVFDEADAEDALQSGAMTEIGTSGIYWKSFTPDAVGEWRVECAKADGSGAVTRHYSVGTVNLEDVGDVLSTVDGKVDTVEGKIDAIDLELDGLVTPPMIG